MSNVNSVSSVVGDEYAYKDEARTVSNDMDKNAFLNLLVTQLKYQDPLEPTNDKEFIAQMAQFTSLEQMQNMNQSMQMSQGYALVGKHVEGSYYNETAMETQYVEGTVEAVKLKDGKVYAYVGGKDIEVAKIQQVTDPTASSVNNSIAMSQAYSMIGKAASATVYNETTEEFETVKGIIESVKKSNGEIYVSLDGRDVKMSDIDELGDSLESAASMELLSQIGESNKLQAYSLIGKTVKGMVYEEDSEEGKEVEGVVERVSIDEGRIYLEIGEDKVAIGNIMSVE